MESIRARVSRSPAAITLLIALIALIALCFSPLAAEEPASAPLPSFNFRFWGLDLAHTSLFKSPLPWGALEFTGASGGGIIERNYFRLVDGSRRPEAVLWPGFSSPTGEEELTTITADLWLRLTQYLDAGSHFRAFAYARSRLIRNIAADAGVVPALFAAGLPEAQGTFENSLGGGLGYTDLAKPSGDWSRKGFRADLCYEWSYELYPEDLSAAFVHEISAEVSLFLPLFSSETLSLVIADHALGSALLGGAIPEQRLSSLGGNRYLPFDALGGIVRGVDDNAADGRLKAANNVELALFFPKLFKGIVVPGILLFFDSGIADDGAFGSDPGTLRLSTGGALTFEAFGFYLYGGGALNVLTGRLEPYVGIGTHF
jgi:hypothetical protein